MRYLHLNCALAIVAAALGGCASQVLGPVEASKAKPVVVAQVVPLSKSAGFSVDLSGGVVGAVMNTANLVDTVRQATSDKIRVVYAYPQMTLLQGEKCMLLSVELKSVPDLDRLSVGDHVVFEKSSGGEMQAKRVFLPDGSPSRITLNDFCYDAYRKYVDTRAKS